MSRGSADTSVFQSYGDGKRRVVAMCVPSLGRVSLLFLKHHYELGIPTNVPVVHVYVEGKEVGDARNECVARSLAMETEETQVSHIFFLDDDVLASRMAFKKLYADDRDIVAGLYFLKTPVATPMVLMDEGGVPKTWRPGDIIDCAGHGMGLTLIKTEVFKRLRDETDLGVDRFGYPCWFKTLRDHQVFRPDGSPAIVNETEDVYFLKRARALGYQPCVDTSADAFGFHFAHNEKRAYPLKQWFEWNAKGTITWDLDDGSGQQVVWGKVA